MPEPNSPRQYEVAFARKGKVVGGIGHNINERFDLPKRCSKCGKRHTEEEVCESTDHTPDRG